jgi:hypothetical protein
LQYFLTIAKVFFQSRSKGQFTSFLPTEAKAALRSLAVMMPSLSASMMPKASLNSWICFWLKRVKMFDPDFLAFFPFGA